ncbi:hypothetical protein LUZ61_017262 [Rhynchospora tenuis]|uniref:Prolyl 4-hydroxylase alpha subunit domain-containing protein n=1 Tax=Rhynchospora tenuis TaxID=198213 RepID=A0AAD6EKV3_9POAL|nr:hypothetical protein LUZ61_017262 [Rhynchospora tenuis]
MSLFSLLDDYVNTIRGGHRIAAVLMYLQMLRKVAKSELTRSSVADNLSGKSASSEFRTSSGMFINKGNDEIVSAIEDKITAWTFISKENGEDIQVSHYEYGQKYEPILITSLTTLTPFVVAIALPVSLGTFQMLRKEELLHHRGVHVKHETLSECAQRGIAGHALLFFNLLPDATIDPKSLHAGCPVIECEKWSATKWICVASFDKVYRTGGNCTGQNESCAGWAALGECTKNLAYMVGTADLPGFCRRSCNIHCDDAMMA